MSLDSASGTLLATYFEVFYEQPAIQRIAIESERLFFGHLKCLLERIGHYMQSLLLLLQYLL